MTRMMNWEQFTVGFWHPFGPHGGEGTGKILQRKSQEIEATGWTLWSFRHHTKATLESWLHELDKIKPDPVFVLCSDSPSAKDPKSEVGNCNTYCPPNSEDWIQIPSTIKIPHPLGARTSASAFKVKRIIWPEQIQEQPAFNVEWWSKGAWRNDTLPGRGEYLVRGNGQTPLRRVYAALELEYPYVVSIQR